MSEMTLVQDARRVLLDIYFMLSETQASDLQAAIEPVFAALRSSTARAERAERRVAELEGRENTVDPNWSVDEELKRATGAEGKFRCPWCGGDARDFGLINRADIGECHDCKRVWGLVLPPSSESTDG